MTKRDSLAEYDTMLSGSKSCVDITAGDRKYVAWIKEQMARRLR